MSIDRNAVDAAVRTVLKRHVLKDNTAETRRKIIYDVYHEIPQTESFQVICDNWNNGPEEISAQIICCDVYFNDDKGGLVCMEFQADRSVLTPEERAKLNETIAKDSVAS